MSIDALTTDIVAAIKPVLPKLRMLEKHHGRIDAGELKKAVGNAPAVLVACVGIPKIQTVADGRTGLTGQLAAYVVARDAKGLDRTAAASAMATTIAGLVDQNQWGRIDVYEPTDIRIDNLFNDAIDRAGCALWAVAWRQELLVGTDLYAPDGSVLEHLYYSHSPEIGEAHKQDYRDIVTGEAPPA